MRFRTVPAPDQANKKLDVARSSMLRPTCRRRPSNYLPRPADKVLECQKMLQARGPIRIWAPTDIWPGQNAFSQRQSWVISIAIALLHSSFFSHLFDLFHGHVQPNHQHEDINRCRHNGWHSRHWLPRYVLPEPNIRKITNAAHSLY